MSALRVSVAKTVFGLVLLTTASVFAEQPAEPASPAVPPPSDAAGAGAPPAQAVPEQAPPSEAPPAAPDAGSQPAAPQPTAAAPAAEKAAAGPESADAPPSDQITHHLEIGVALSGTWMSRPLALGRAGVESDRIIGYGASASLAYRGPFFLYPFFELGYFNLASSTVHPVTNLRISNEEVENSISSWTWSIGPGVDVGAMRFRLGLGLVFNEISSKGRDFDDERTAGGFVNSLLVSGYLLRKPGFRLGIEGRASYMPYSSTLFLAVGVGGAGDAISW